MSDTTKAADPNTSTEDGKKAAGDSAEGAGSQAAKTDDAPKFTQADLDRIAAKARKEEREKAQRESEEAERKRKEEEAKKQGEFEALYNELKPQHEAQAATLTKYQDTVKALAEAELNALPAEVKEMSPSLDDPLAVLAWLPKGKALAERLEGQPAKRGAREDPKPKGGGSDPEVEKRARTAQASTTRNAF